MNMSAQWPAALAPSQGRREESLTCNSCRKNFDAHRRRPLSLQCCHSYCETCVTGMTTGKHGKKITCAQCKKTTKIDNCGNGNVLPVNYAILKMISVNNQTVPGSVTVTGNCDSPGLVRSAFEQVTVIPVNSGEAPRQVQCKENRSSCQMTPPTGRPSCQHDDRMTSSDMNNQCPGTISISIGELHPMKNCAKAEKTPSSSEITNAHASSTTCVTVTSSTNGFPSCPPPNSQVPCQNAAPSVGPTTVVPNLGPTVTSLTVKTPGSSSHPTPTNPSCQPSAPVDLCSQCCVNQAAVTVTSAARMSSRKLCTGCYALVQSRADEELIEVQNRNPAPSGRRGANQTCALDGPPTTVIKVSDENSTSVQSPCPVPEPPNKCEPTACQLTPIPNDDGCHRGSIHVDRIKVPSAKRPADVMNKWMAREESPATAEGASKEECLCKPTPANKLAYQACSKFDLGSIRKSENPVSVKSSTECCPLSENLGAAIPEEISNEPEYRPLPYNPNFAGSDAPIPLEPLQPEAPTLDPSYPPLLNPTLSSGSYNEKQPLDYQPPAPQYPLLPGAPPSYEEITGQHTQGAAPSATVRLVHCFGKYGEIATQPGAFRSPGRVNVSRSGVVVVSDSAHRTVQAFSPNGECLSLIRVSGDAVGGSSCYENNKLAVGTNAGVQIYDFNGLLKKTIPLGLVVNTVATGASGFIAVQPKALHIFRGPNEALFRTLRGRSKPGPTQQLIPFDCIADAAVNSQQVSSDLL